MEAVMNSKREITVYNIMLPLWLLLFWPSPLWLFLIPANYVIDRLILWWGLKGLEERSAFCRKHTWEICLAGFLGDFIGVIILFCVSFLPEFIWEDLTEISFFEDLMYGVGFNPFSNLVSFLVVVLAIAVSGVVIYRMDKAILKRAGIEENLAKAAALKLALITAPYLYLIPSSIMYTSV